MVLALLLFIAGCSSLEDQLYQTLEEVVSKEKGFEKQQKPLAELEVKEKELFDEMMQLGMKEFDQITDLADQALENLNKREQLLASEQKAMDNSKKEFNKMSNYIKKINDDEVKEKVQKLYQLMEERYESHEQLIVAYEELIEEDRKIYEMVKDKDLELEQLTSQIDEANQALESVNEVSDQFNKQTDTFNELKLELYEEIGMKVKGE